MNFLLAVGDARDMALAIQYVSYVKKFGSGASIALIPEDSNRVGFFAPVPVAKKTYDRIVCFERAPPDVWKESADLVWVSASGSYNQDVLESIEEGTPVVWHHGSTPLGVGKFPDEREAVRPDLIHFFLDLPSQLSVVSSREFSENAWKALFFREPSEKKARAKSSLRTLIVVPNLGDEHGIQAAQAISQISTISGVSAFFSVLSSVDPKWPEEVFEHGARIIAPDPKDWETVDLDSVVFCFHEGWDSVLERETADAVRTFLSAFKLSLAVFVQDRSMAWSDEHWAPDCVVVSREDDVWRAEAVDTVRTVLAAARPRDSFLKEALRQRNNRSALKTVLLDASRKDLFALLDACARRNVPLKSGEAICATTPVSLVEAMELYSATDTIVLPETKAAVPSALMDASCCGTTVFHSRRDLEAWGLGTFYESMEELADRLSAVLKDDRSAERVKREAFLTFREKDALVWEKVLKEPVSKFLSNEKSSKNTDRMPL